MEILNWTLWVIGLLTVVVVVSAVLAHLWLITAETITEARRQKTVIADRVVTCHRWFSGWEDLDVIWNYIFNGGDINYVRAEYAKLRGTNVYGKESK